MKKKALSFLLALVMCLSLLPAASAAEADLPDWYFLFAIFKNVDADGKDRDGKAVHVKYSMSQDEVDIARSNAKDFEEYMNSVGVMRAHVEVVEIDETVTELNEYSNGFYLGSAQAAPLLKNKVDLDRYDHVTCIVSLDNLATKWMGVTGSPFENGTGQSCANFVNRAYALKNYTASDKGWPPSLYVHEFLHFMERMNRKWGEEFVLHRDGKTHYDSTDQWKTYYTDVILNQIKDLDVFPEGGTGVAPVTWQYPPHMLRTMTELTIPSGVTSIGHDAFLNYTNLTSVTIPSSVTYLDISAFHGCASLTSIIIPASVTSIEDWAFNYSGVTDVYYGGTEAQWKSVSIGSHNSPLTKATIHYSHLLADVKTTDYFAQPVAWALEKGITTGTGNGSFSPGQNCTVAQILTFLWRANGSPKPAGSSPFSDVKSGSYFADAAAWAYEKGIVSGGTLGGDTPCTRSMAVTYMWKAAGSPSAKAAGFTDVPAGADYAQAVAWAVEKGVTAGTSAATFSPDSACTRGQIVTFLYRALAG